MEMYEKWYWVFSIVLCGAIVMLMKHIVEGDVFWVLWWMACIMLLIWGVVSACRMMEMDGDRGESRAEESVERIIEDLSDRMGLKQEWGQIDDDIKEEIKQKWREIIFNELWRCDHG